MIGSACNEHNQKERAAVLIQELAKTNQTNKMTDGILTGNYEEFKEGIIIYLGGQG